MVINLNKKMISKESLMQHITDLEVYNMYIKEPISLKNVISSPLRDEKNPSFGFFIGENAEICFKDFVIGSGDCIRFVQLKFGLNYFEAMSKIALDANLEDHFIIKNTFKINEKANPNYQSRTELIASVNSSSLSKKNRAPQLYDLSFWNQFGIDGKTLKKYNVTPISHIFFGTKVIVADELAYCFTETKDGIETYKIYQPKNQQYKWLNNHNESVWQGWEQLPETGDKLIITKSLKDVMAIDNICQIPAISLQAESVFPKQHIVDQLRERFKAIYLLYDNDYDKEVNWGREFGKKLSDQFNFFQIEIEDSLESKDFSDLIKKHGTKIAKETLEELTQVPF